MNSTTSALLGALIGAVTALVSAGLASLVALHNERKRREDAARASFVESLRSAAASVFAEFYNFSHAISWIAWYAKYDPSSVDSEMVRIYERDVHATFPKLQGSLAIVAGLSLTVYEELQPLVRRLFVLDKHVSIAIGNYQSNRAAAVESLGKLIDEVNDVQDRLPPEINRIIRLAQAGEPRRRDPE